MHWYIKRKKSLEYKKWENDPLSGETECQRVVKLDGVQWTRSETNGAESFERCPATERKAIRWEASRRKTRPGRLTKPAVKICKSIMVERSRITLKKVHWRMKRRTKLLKPWKKKAKLACTTAVNCPIRKGISIVLKTHAVFLQEKWQTVENKSNHLDPVFRGVEHIEHSCSIEYFEEVSSC